MCENRTIIPICCGILSILLKNIQNINYYKQYFIEKFTTLSYNDYICIWLQRLFLIYNDIDICGVKMCDLVNNNQNNSNILWNISFLKDEIQEIFKNYSVINTLVLNNNIITQNEINELGLFLDYIQLTM